MVSGALDPSDGVRHPIPNVDWMIPKPFSLKQLGEAIKAVLSPRAQTPPA
jgi:DNA-binding response OmpR family regulator